jgi:hypothetical protein
MEVRDILYLAEARTAGHLSAAAQRALAAVAELALDPRASDETLLAIAEAAEAELRRISRRLIVVEVAS